METDHPSRPPDVSSPLPALTQASTVTLRATPLFDTAPAQLMPAEGTAAVGLARAPVHCTAPPTTLSTQKGGQVVRVADIELVTSLADGDLSNLPQAVPALQVPIHRSHLQVSSPASKTLNPQAESFTMRDAGLVHGGQLHPDLDQDWAAVKVVQAGGVGQRVETDLGIWDQAPPSKTHQKSGPIDSGEQASLEPQFPLSILPGVLDSSVAVPAKPILRASSLKERIIITPSGRFIDRFLPVPTQPLVPRSTFTASYFSSLHNLVAAAGIRADGSTYPALTPNFLGARLPLKHVGMKVERWRYHLRGYEDNQIVQHIQYGFPLGLTELPQLKSSTRNHGSSYGFYTHVDKFITEEIKLGGLTGPFDKVPWWDMTLSPLMTAPKKPSSRRTVYDASYGDYSLNNSTPSDTYLGQPCVYTFPKIDDFRMLVLRCGQGCFMFKRDLSRFFLQLPLDPVEYHRVGFLWRGLFFFFIGLAFGLRHSGLQGQKITDALAWIHRRLGLETEKEKQFNLVNYSDDLGGVEPDLSRATESFEKLKVLMDDLGVDESCKKAEPPTTQMVYLGVMFDSQSLQMRVPPEKLAEVKSEIVQWSRKSTFTKKNLQSLLGKLFWVARVVRLARVFMGRLLQQLRDMPTVSDNIKVKLSDEARKDLKWWHRYLEHFNGIQMIIHEDPLPLELDQMLDKPEEVYAGDATPVGAGGWYSNQYWCRKLPLNLQDTAVGIHLKEFWTLIVSAKLWGSSWSGRAITLFCDNDAVVDTINHKKPKDSALLSLLREFLFIAVTFKFIPVVRKIGTKQNNLADHISRRHDHLAAARVFNEAGLPDMVRVEVPDQFFVPTDFW